MAKIKLVEVKKDDRADRIEALKKEKFASKEAARRAATEAGVQDFLKPEVVKSKKKDK